MGESNAGDERAEDAAGVFSRGVTGIFVRHGQSTANAGLFTPEFARIALTPAGEAQAEELAEAWTREPTLIAVSPYLRAQQTAAPTIARFPGVPVETWPIHEFTYWDPSYWSNSDPANYPEDRARFWSEADPAYRQGDQAETFSEFLARARAALQRLEAQPPGAEVLLFTHGHFIQAVRHEILYQGKTDGEKMAGFDAFNERWPVRNGQRVPAEFDGSVWRLDDASLAEG